VKWFEKIVSRLFLGLSLKIQILAEGGFAPEWIMLKRDIETEKQKIRDEIRTKCADIFYRQNLTPRERQDWNRVSSL
jgi:hypothetical protein